MPIASRASSTPKYCQLLRRPPWHDATTATPSYAGATTPQRRSQHKLRRNAAGSTTATTTTTSSRQGQQLWISDSLLTQAWNRFLSVNRGYHVRCQQQQQQRHLFTGQDTCRRRSQHRNHGPNSSAASTNSNNQHARYGSNVPGPLEANKRLAKRKNTALAGHGHGAGMTEFGALFGAGKNGRAKGGGWKAQEQRKSWSLPGNAAGGTWGPDVQKEMKEDAKVEEDMEESEEEDEEGRFNMPSFDGSYDIDEEFDYPQLYMGESEYELQPRDEHSVMLASLEECRCLQDIHDLIQIHDWNLHTNPEYSTTIVDYCVRDHSMRFEVLVDIDINIPEARNFAHIVRRFQTEVGGRTLYRDVFAAFQQRIVLGIVSTEELHEVIQGIPELQGPEGILHEDGRGLVKSYQLILDGIEQCPIISPQDLGTAFFDDWLVALSRKQPTAGVLELARRIIEMMPPVANDFEFRGVQELVVQWISRLYPWEKKSCVRWEDFKALNGRSSKPPEQEQQIQDLSQILRSLPGKTGCTITLQVMETLLGLAQIQEVYGTSLSFWVQVIRATYEDWRHLDEEVWESLPEIQMSPAEDAPNTALLARLWIISALFGAHGREEARRERLVLRLQRFLDHAVYSYQGVTMSNATHEEVFLRLLHNLNPLTEHILQPLISSFSACDTLGFFALFRIPEHNLVKREMRTGYNTVATSFDILSPACRDMLVSEVTKAKSQGIAARFLRHHRTLEARLYLAGYLLGLDVPIDQPLTLPNIVPLESPRWKERPVEEREVMDHKVVAYDPVLRNSVDVEEYIEALDESILIDEFSTLESEAEIELEVELESDLEAIKESRDGPSLLHHTSSTSINDDLEPDNPDDLDDSDDSLTLELLHTTSPFTNDDDNNLPLPPHISKTRYYPFHPSDRLALLDPESLIFPYLLLIEDLAFHAAHSPNLTPTQSWLRVRWFYRFLAKHRIPPTKAMLRAMWYAGFVRYQRERLGVGRRQMRFIMGVVERALGGEVVEKWFRDWEG